MSLDLNKIGSLIDEMLADETEETLTKWLDKRRQNASKEEKALIKNDVIESSYCECENPSDVEDFISNKVFCRECNKQIKQ